MNAEMYEQKAQAAHLLIVLLRAQKAGIPQLSEAGAVESIISSTAHVRDGQQEPPRGKGRRPPWGKPQSGSGGYF